MAAKSKIDYLDDDHNIILKNDLVFASNYATNYK